MKHYSIRKEVPHFRTQLLMLDNEYVNTRLNECRIAGKTNAEHDEIRMGYNNRQLEIWYYTWKAIDYSGFDAP